MKLYQEAIPILLKSKDKKYFGMTMPPREGKTVFYFTMGAGQYFYPSSDSSKLSAVKNSSAFDFLGLHAKIISCDASIEGLGQKQRKEDCLGSVLRVIKYANNDDTNNIDVFTLQTSRADGATIAFYREDLRFIYPTIRHTIDTLTPLNVGDQVIAIKSDSAKSFESGDKCKIVSIIKSSHNRDFDVLICKKGKEEIAGYSKNFKLAK